MLLSTVVAGLVAGLATLPTGPAPASVVVADPVAILHVWDRARADAFVQDDSASLRGLYVRGSTAATHEVRVLRAYRRAGVRVTAMTTQLFSATVARADAVRVGLDVVDRVIATGDDGRRCLRLEASAPRHHHVVIHRQGGHWLVESVR